MGITRTAIVDDDGSGTTGTGLDAAWKTELYDQIDAADVATAALSTALPTSTAPTTTGTQTALAIPTGTGDLVLYLNNATLLTIQGIAAGTANQKLTLISKGAGQVDLAHLHASGTALGKLKLFATSGLTSLAAGVGVAVLRYDATVTQWRLVLHEQGDWIAPAFDATHYAASGTMAWTLTSPDRAGQAYWLRGRELDVLYSLDLTTVVAPLSTDLRLLNTGYGGYTALAQQFNDALSLASDNGTIVDAFSQINSGGTYIRFLKKSFANWVASTNGTTIYGKSKFGVT